MSDPAQYSRRAAFGRTAVTGIGLVAAAHGVSPDAASAGPSADSGGVVLGETVSTVHQWNDRRIVSDAPAIVRLSSGRLLCACELWSSRDRDRFAESEYGRDRCLMFASDDDGVSWREVARLPFTSGKLLWHRNSVYMIGSGPDWTGLWVTRSDDGGQQWREPVCIRKDRTYAASTGWVVRDDRLYWAIDSYRPSDLTREVFAIRIDLSRDLLEPTSWTISNGVRHPGLPESLGRGEHDGGKWMEPNVIANDGRLSLVVRVRASHGGTDAAVQGIAAICDLTDTGRTLDLAFSHYYAVPGAQNHFHIIYDEPSGLHWMLSNQVSGVATGLYRGWGKERRILMLHYSADGANWLTAGPAAVAPHPLQAYNYCTPIIEGNDLLFASRTAIDAANQHDNDRITFHRVRSFRAHAVNLHTSSRKERNR